MGIVPTSSTSIQLAIGDALAIASLNKKHFLNELKNRRADCLRSNKKIGIKKSIFLNFKDNQLDSYPILKIIKKIEKKIKLFKPTIIFTHFYNDLNVQLKTGNRDFYGFDFRWIKYS